jgi:hypothetical protein
MSISYCSLYSKPDKILLAESTSVNSPDHRIHNLLGTIIKSNNLTDIIEIENKQLVTYLKAKKLILICTSHKDDGEERPKRFMEQFFTKIKNIYPDIGTVIPSQPQYVFKLCLQSQLGKELNGLIESFDTGIYKNKALVMQINHDLNDIKTDITIGIKKVVKGNEDMQQLLLTSQKISSGAKEYYENVVELEKETRCLKPWMVYVLIGMFALLVVYVVFALYRCGNLSMFCEKKKNSTSKY